MRLRRLQAFKGLRKRTGRGRSQTLLLDHGSSSQWPHEMRLGTGRSHLMYLCRAVSDHMIVELALPRSRECAKASKRGKKSFVRRRRSSIKKDTTALRFRTSCERPG